ncbi:hypothetical protein [Streptomyces noursei]|uniref:hypothetical protein n=1 Tax=Streptomyces noursei TaxID=1971 RepID=UPI00289A7531
MEAGYVEQRKAVRNTRQRVWLCLTPRGDRHTRRTSPPCAPSSGPKGLPINNSPS